MTDTLASRYFSQAELEAMGFKQLGRNVQLSRTARLYVPEYIALGDHCIVDDFCILSGSVALGRNVHLAHSCRLIGGLEGIRMADFSGLAFGVTMFAQSDDYNGDALTNPTVPMRYRKILRARIEVGQHVIVGAHTVIFPGVTLGEGSSVGACSMVTKSTEPWAVYFGAPAKRLKSRRRGLLAREAEYLSDQALLSDDGKT